MIQAAFEIVEIGRAGLRIVIEFGDGHALVAGIGPQHLAILRMHGARDQHAALAR